MESAAAGPRTEAATRRKTLHRAVARKDLQMLRKALHELYVDKESPLYEMGEVKRVETYAPIVEAAIAARIYAPTTTVCREMMLNLEHTHEKFGIKEEDYDLILLQLEQLDEGGADPQSIDWCVGTCLHGRVKPFRHSRLFSSETASIPSSSDSPGEENPKGPAEAA